MATIPLAPILPEINTSANIALSRWNEMIKQGQEQFADYLASMVRLGQVGASNVVDPPLPEYTLSYSPYNLYIPNISIKIGEFFNELGSVGNKLIPSDLRSSSCLIAVVVFEFSFDHTDTTVTGTDGQTIPVESNYDSVVNHESYQYGLFDGRDFGDFSGGTTFDGWYHFGSGTKETGLFHTLAETQGSETNTKFFVSGINVNQTSVTQISTGSIKFAIPFAILTTSDSWSTVNILKTFNPHDINNSYPDMVWSIPTIYDQIVAGNTGLSNVVNSFPVKLEKSGKTLMLEGDNITLAASNKDVKLSIDTSSNLSNIQISDTTGLNDINLNVYGNVVATGSIEASGNSNIDGTLTVANGISVTGNNSLTKGTTTITNGYDTDTSTIACDINITGGDVTISAENINGDGGGLSVETISCTGGVVCNNIQVTNTINSYKLKTDIITAKTTNSSISLDKTLANDLIAKVFKIGDNTQFNNIGIGTWGGVGGTYYWCFPNNVSGHGTDTALKTALDNLAGTGTLVVFYIVNNSIYCNIYTTGSTTWPQNVNKNFGMVFRIGM